MVAESQNPMTITITFGELAMYQTNGVNLYWTPGATKPYWATQASFREDVCVATPRDFLNAAGYDTWEGMDDIICDEQVALDIPAQQVFDMPE